MSEIDKYYQILELKQVASKEEIRQAYKDLVNVWHPDRFENKPHLQQKANEKLKEINLAYKKLTEYMANSSYETYESETGESTASDYEERQTLFLYNQRTPVKIDVQHAIAHNKVMIIDEETVIAGSFNFTKAAEENNAENLLVIRDRNLAERYTKNWQEHAQHSEVYAGRSR
ncbi:MAG TPA: phospholipase D-like domain-containing protein [Thermodesulfobacteriota bacterium]|nr:phospholipase D-like domain-containing protein [Thermodesulfobacteriota bacterium]